MAEPAEVREWARSEGMEVSGRGAIPAYITEAYDLAHPTDGSVPVDAVSYPPAEDAGVTEADFPPPLETGDETGSPAANGQATAPKRERKPRTVKATRPSTRKGWKNVWGQATAKTKTRTGTRTDLSEFAEDTWRDLALLAGGIMPPVSRVLTIQAPYAGVVFDEAIRGLPIVDAVLQPVARASVSLRALNGLLGPAFFTTAICVQGEWQSNEDGSPVFGPDGRPAPTQRTAMMLGGLKYSLLQMSRTADLSKVQERAEVDAERMRRVDQLVDFIFGFPPAQQASAPAQDGATAPYPQPPSPPAPGQVLTPTFVYPPPPKMDDVGAPA